MGVCRKKLVLWSHVLSLGVKGFLPNRKLKRSSSPITGLDRPRSFQKVEVPRFQDNWHMNVVRLSALRTGRLYSNKYSWYSFLLEAESTPGP